MTYNTFKTTLIAELQGYFPPKTTISVHKLPRNNHVTVDGLTILEPGCSLTPTIYLEEYYDAFQKGQTMPETLKQILQVYHAYRPAEQIDPSLLSDFENIREKIVYKLVHYERNRELLSSIPHIPFLDLAIVFYCLVSSGPSGAATILVQDFHLKLWDTNLQQLHQLAKENTPFLLSSRVQNLSTLLESASPPDFRDQVLDMAAFPMYVLTNEIGFLGAACLLYDELLSDLACRMKTDFYVIPSSVHEVLLIPAQPDMQAADFNDMIKEVNATQLEPEEILSDHVYFYSRKEKRLLG